ncbi:MAG: histone deacetylase [Candidatus Aminicenantaceae bacterium]
MERTGILLDRRYLDHNMGAFHVESPQRLEAILGMIDQTITFPFLSITPRAAQENELLWIHTPEHVESVRSTAGQDRVVLDPDTSTSPRSYETALLAAGGLLECLDHILSGRIRNAFAPVRPPGHHAEAGRAMGFCLFNNVAVATEYLQRQHGLAKILVVDWDIHHGNGTQNAFFDRADVLYFSTHQFPHYPGTGHWSETGTGQGEGFTLNVPLLPGKTDEDFLYIFRKILSPAARQFEPDAILVSAGFDVAATDPLGGMDITALGFAALTRELLSLAQELCQDRLLIALEGGYDLTALSQGSHEVLLQLSGTGPQPDIRAEASPQLEQELKPMLKHWGTSP